MLFESMCLDKVLYLQKLENNGEITLKKYGQYSIADTAGPQIQVVTQAGMVSIVPDEKSCRTSSDRTTQQVVADLIYKSRDALQSKDKVTRVKRNEGFDEWAFTLDQVIMECSRTEFRVIKDAVKNLEKVYSKAQPAEKASDQ